MDKILKFFKDYTKECVTGAVLFVLYMPTFMWMWDRWFARDSYYSHGILIPFVTIYLIWQKRDELAKIPRGSSAIGLWLIILGIGLHLFSALFRIYFSSGFSFIIVLFGLILHFFGAKIFKAIAFPALFLVFMIPLPEVVITNLSFKLKILAAEIATTTLNNMRIPAVQQGSVIRMMHTQVVVDDVCSGLRSLISLTALGSIFAYWLKGPLYKKILLFLSTIPTAIITNVCRIIFLSFISEVWGAKYATGFTHDFSGFLVFAIAFLLLFVFSKLLEEEEAPKTS